MAWWISTRPLVSALSRSASPSAIPVRAPSNIIAATSTALIRSRCCSPLSAPGVRRYRSSTPRLILPHWRGSANIAATSVCSATAAAKTGPRAWSATSDRSATSTGAPVAAASMHAPSFRLNWRSSSNSAVGSVAHNVSRAGLRVSTDRPAPWTSSPSTQAWQIVSATVRSRASAHGMLSNARVTKP